jgi:ubiquinone/menaquinone biosynthesis C-methylase UbiE
MKKDTNKAGWEAERAHKLDNEERRRTLPPAQTLKKLGLAAGMNFLDVGCGIGYFTLPAARIAGLNARVYAADVSADMLAILSEKAAREELSNIAVILADEYDMKIEAGMANYALCCNVLHEVKDRERFALEIARVLSSGGLLAVIEWKKIRGERGPAAEERIAPAELEELLCQCGFVDLRQTEINEDLYAVAAKKK